MTQNELKELLHYNSETGIFTWIVSRGSIKSGKEIINTNNDYLYIKINKKTYKGHRLAWLYVYGYFPNLIDHINGIGIDNRLCNLRKATSTQNNYNASLRKDNKSGAKGISWHKKQNKWVANIHIDGKQKQIGSFDNLEDAIKVINETRLLNHGEFSRIK